VCAAKPATGRPSMRPDSRSGHGMAAEEFPKEGWGSPERGIHDGSTSGRRLHWRPYEWTSACVGGDTGRGVADDGDAGRAEALAVGRSVTDSAWPCGGSATDCDVAAPPDLLFSGDAGDEIRVGVAATAALSCTYCWSHGWISVANVKRAIATVAHAVIFAARAVISADAVATAW
jgi:hypothetical protein